MCVQPSYFEVAVFVSRSRSFDMRDLIVGVVVVVVFTMCSIAWINKELKELEQLDKKAFSRLPEYPHCIKFTVAK